MDLYSLFAQFYMYLNGLSVIKENSSTHILKLIISCLHCYSQVYVNILVSKLIVDIFFYDQMSEIDCLKNTIYIHKNSPIKHFKSWHLIRFDNLDL